MSKTDPSTTSEPTPEPERLAVRVALYRVVGLLALASAFGCAKAPEQKFKEGDMVESVIDGRKGQVIRTWDDGYLRVRFGATEDRTHLLGGTISHEPYSTVVMKEWELRAAHE